MWFLGIGIAKVVGKGLYKLRTIFTKGGRHEILLPS
jgi:hypothetical protein